MAFSKFTSPASDLHGLYAMDFTSSGERSSGWGILEESSNDVGGNMYRLALSMSMTLSEYVNRIITTCGVILPGYPADMRLVLTAQIQQLMRRVLELMPDPETNPTCFFELEADNVRVDLRTKQPFLHGVSWTPNYDHGLAQMNYARVGNIFRDIIFNGEFDSLPQDFQVLLELMESWGHVASYSIKHHCSLVWAVDKKEFFSRIYDYAHNILREEDPVLYEQVMENLGEMIPEQWETPVLENQYLAKFYGGSTYLTGGTDAGKEALRFERNTYSHSLEYAWDRVTRRKMYNQADLGEMMEAALPLVLHYFQLELEQLGLLRLTMLESLFH